MYLTKDKKEAIAHATQNARERLKILKGRKELDIMTRGDIFEWDMCIDLIRRGEKLLGLKPENLEMENI